MKLSDIRRSSVSTLQVRVTPKAAANRIKVEELENGDYLIRVYVTTVPEDGKANKAVLELLAKELGIAKSKLTIVKGLTGKDKTIQISE